MRAALRTRSVTEMIFSMVVRRFYASRRRLPRVKSRPDTEAGEPAVERAARQAEHARGLADVAGLRGERALDQVALDLLEGHLLEARRDVGARAELEVIDGDLGAGGEQAGALDDVLEL